MYTMLQRTQVFGLLVQLAQQRGALLQLLPLPFVCFRGALQQMLPCVDTV